MQHHLKIIAKNFRLNQKDLEELALKNPRKYGINNNNGFITTTTLFTETLIKDFTNEQDNRNKRT